MLRVAPSHRFLGDVMLHLIENITGLQLLVFAGLLVGFSLSALFVGHLSGVQSGKEMARREIKKQLEKQLKDESTLVAVERDPNHPRYGTYREIGSSLHGREADLYLSASSELMTAGHARRTHSAKRQRTEESEEFTR